MTDLKVLDALRDSPSIRLLNLRNKETVILFLMKTFPNQQGIVSYDKLVNDLTDFLDQVLDEEIDEEIDISFADSYDVKAKKYIKNWTDSGFLTNYQDGTGEIFYELSTHSSKTIDWISTLTRKEEYVGTESKFKNIFNQLKELVEFTNEDVEARISLLEEKKLEIEQDIQRIKNGDIKVFEPFEIISRFNQVTQSAKELLSDFKEVEDNFKSITKEIYQKHAEGNLSKSSILQYTFDALDGIKESAQGKSFYAFWSFLLNPDLQKEWDDLTHTLYAILEEKEIPVNDLFLSNMKRFLHQSGQKVSKANDKMAEKLSRVIRENGVTKNEATKMLIQDIKKLLIEISEQKQKPDISIELDIEVDINMPFERKLTFEQTEELIYRNKPKLADADISEANQLDKLFKLSVIDKDILRRKIKSVLRNKSQTTLKDIIVNNGGIQKGLAEVFGYMSIIKEFKHTISPDKTELIRFDETNEKIIKIPEIILTNG